MATSLDRSHGRSINPTDQQGVQVIHRDIRSGTLIEAKRSMDGLNLNLRSRGIHWSTREGVGNKVCGSLCPLDLKGEDGELLPEALQARVEDILQGLGENPHQGLVVSQDQES